MSVLAFGADDLFRITVVKYLSTNPDRKWANNYELRAKGDGVLSDLVSVGSKIANYEKQIHFTPVQFDRLRISTWEEDSVPYDPEVFVSLPLSYAGVAALGGGQLEPLNICWDVARVPLSGRFGHIYYRGCLVESRVEAPAGKAVLQDPSGMQTILEAGLDEADAVGLFEGIDVLWDVVMINKTGTQVRTVASLVSRGVAVVPFDHAWFNRTPSA